MRLAKQELMDRAREVTLLAEVRLRNNVRCST